MQPGGGRYIIGIDPDADKSGIAVLDTATRTFVRIAALPFAELLNYAIVLHNKSDKPLKVYVEAGWLNTGNWHLSRTDSRQKCAALGVSVGRNQETGRKLIEMLSYYGVPVEPVRPLVKCWKGRDRKITHAELSAFADVGGRTNQEERDAALIAWEKAGLPIRI